MIADFIAAPYNCIVFISDRNFKYNAVEWDSVYLGRLFPKIFERSKIWTQTVVQVLVYDALKRSIIISA